MKRLISGVMLCLSLCLVYSAVAEEDAMYQEYLDFFEEVFQTFQENYYKDINRADFDRFIAKFDEQIYPQLKTEGKSVDFVRWRSASFMVDHLKDQEDVFSAFYPPKPAKEYHQTSLGKRIDLGIEGEKLPLGYRVTFIEPRSDAYKKGLRENDLLVRINEEDISVADETQIRDMLVPLEGETVQLSYLNGQTRRPHNIAVVSQEYFKQALFDIPVPIPSIYCLKLERFNRKTSEDMVRYMDFYRSQGPIQGLIIDLRGNPGGPPLAAREISAFFLEGGSDFAYFQKKGQPKAELDVPKVPEVYHYDGPMVILIDEKSGSASELFSGILQKRDRAVLMGQNSAGQVMLKSMFNFDDESMLLFITSRGHHPDGSVFSFSGLNPDKYFSEQETEDALKYAATYLMYVNQKQEEL